MKKLLMAVLPLSLMSSSVVLAKDPAKKQAKKAVHSEHLAPEISLTELKALVDSKSVVVIDANGADSYKNGHIPGAIHFAKHEEKKDLKNVLPADKNALIVAYCGGPLCTAWEAAAADAKKEGYTNIKHLKAGIKGWKEAKYPIEKT